MFNKQIANCSFNNKPKINANKQWITLKKVYNCSFFKESKQNGPFLNLKIIYVLYIILA